MILANTPPPTLNAATLRTFKELGLSILCLKALWALSSEGESILSPQGTFLFPSACTPFPQVRNISPRRWEMGPSLRPGEGLESWL